MRKLVNIASVTLLVAAFGLSCGKKEEEKKDDTPSEPLMGDAHTNISNVSSTMIPASMQASTTLKLQEEGGDPCADADDFFDCQPNLIKLYLAMGKHMVDGVNEILAGAAEGLKEIKDGQSGTIEVTDEDGTSKVSFDVTSRTVFKILLSTSTGPFIYMDVADNVYKIKFDVANMPEEDGEEGGGPGKVEATITYTDENNYQVDLFLSGMECQADDVQAPNAIAININRVSGVSQGKAMMYLPRWLGENLSCETTPTDETKMFIYTDFVGDDTNTTAALYMLDVSVASVDAFANHTAADFCTNWPSACVGGASMGSSVAIADAYQNNFCASASDLTWNTNCTSESELISTPTFSASSLWILPGDLDDKAVELPTEL